MFRESMHCQSLFSYTPMRCRTEMRAFEDHEATSRRTAPGSHHARIPKVQRSEREGSERIAVRTGKRPCSEGEVRGSCQDGRNRKIEVHVTAFLGRRRENPPRIRGGPSHRKIMQEPHRPRRERLRSPTPQHCRNLCTECFANPLHRWKNVSPIEEKAFRPQVKDGDLTSQVFPCDSFP